MWHGCGRLLKRRRSETRTVGHGEHAQCPEWFTFMWLAVRAESCPTLCDPTDCIACRPPLSLNFPAKNNGVGCHFFPTQGSNPRLLHLLRWQADPLLLHHLGSLCM